MSSYFRHEWLVNTTVIDRRLSICPSHPENTVDYFSMDGCGVIRRWTHDLLTLCWTLSAAPHGSKPWTVTYPTNLPPSTPCPWIPYRSLHLHMHLSVLISEPEPFSGVIIVNCSHSGTILVGYFYIITRLFVFWHQSPTRCQLLWLIEKEAIEVSAHFLRTCGIFISAVCCFCSFMVESKSVSG